MRAARAITLLPQSSSGPACGCPQHAACARPAPETVSAQRTTAAFRTVGTEVRNPRAGIARGGEPPACPGLVLTRPAEATLTLTGALERCRIARRMEPRHPIEWIAAGDL